MSESSTSSIILGCSVAVISSGLQSLGITLQRKSHLLHIQYLPIDSTIPTNTNTSNIEDQQQEHEQEQHLRRQIHLNHQQQKYKRNMWLFGFLLFIIANVLGSIIQISTLPLIILSPLQSIGLIFNSILSCLLLPGDHFTNKLWVGTGIISLGAIIIAYNGNVNSMPPNSPSKPLPPIDERFHLILQKLINPSFVVWFIGTFIMMLGLLLVNYIYLNKKIRQLQSRQPFSIITMSNDNNNNNKAKHIPVNSCNNKYQFFKGVNYGIISGTLTAHTFLFAKSIIDVIIETILHENFKNLFTITNALPYLLLLTMLSIVGLQLTAFNLGLAQITTAILYPLCFLIYNFINLINDLIFNSLITSHKMTWLQLVWIIIGLVGVLCGVVILSWDSAFNANQNQRNFKNGHDHGIGIEDGTDLISMKFPYNNNSGNGIDNDNNVDPHQSYLFGRVDEQTELLEGSRSGSTPLSSSSSYNSADSGPLDVYKPYSDEPTKDSATITIQQQQQKPNIEALIELNDEAAIDAEISMLSKNSTNQRLSFEQNQLLNSLDLSK
ncbi:hypothetical integral membrane protein, conserved [Candida dubliniensis CD36]|uniref:Hypothetical integral membrane protein, conserved n=1 Tax=Candida dubliniensis (strain CD36 / ATCC MYA-646 / CBS 7987 / NCPF 3949 / NRRL Y-17841) TaxID=573826 RepID=B9WBE1_CANDC|nr:hypothetical integral membrane protein, conserved [Candida dubliniensis CD36]CAX43712.1 hypothetical integral membrane protein, conserved [Candida dubliniensis CD36]